MPLIGGAVTAGYVLNEAFDHASHGDTKRAIGSIIAGIPETIGNASGLGLLGLGDAFHFVSREAITAIAGEDYTPDQTDAVVTAQYVMQQFS